jgi:riboflavin kinase/FMN adenylyltransferase
MPGACEVVRGVAQLKRRLSSPAVAIGNFDGVHRGHQAILACAQEEARALGGEAVVYTFRPHPRLALRPESEVPLLLTYDEKLGLIAASGIRCVVEEPFSREFSTQAPERFFTDALIGRLGARVIVVGHDFAFGKERGGDLDSLARLCREHGVQLRVLPPERDGDEPISSSRIRRDLLAGRMEDAARLLGRPFFYRGTVIRGEGRGRKLGFPTANLRLESKLALSYGVYATWAVTPDGIAHPSVTNVGVRPTFADLAGLPALIETHLLDGALDLYGTTLEVRFVARLREERKFAGVDALKEQIARDGILARERLGANARLT